ncbi:CopG family transcriptional regulator [Olsenella uli]|uniref:CopG family transcriptional regulator n=1 Tax=Olsenella uli TaxID=133926 RepID=UPI0016514C7F|nr:CopG family transcriptional regulator [Olsenella uli]
METSDSVELGREDGAYEAGTGHDELSQRRASTSKKVNVDFTVRQLADLDDEAAYLGIPRQAVIKTLCDEALTRRRIERKRAFQ